MKRILMATVALSALVAGTAIAQDMSSEPSMMSSEPMMSSESMMSSEPKMSTEQPMDTMTPGPGRDFDIVTGYSRIDTDRLASKIIGMPVYDGAMNASNNLGNINDLVLDESGAIAAAIIGVGGFLGIGEKQVAVDFQALQWVVAEDNTERYVISATIDELTSAPDFEFVDDQPGDAMAPAGDAMMAPDAMSSAPAM